ncbi:MAG: heavy-metal-associated domain-containing protein [Streptosporangiales bacterium]|nr:heavy-metal-associated domain-containing protein [Streptosporangiales bacterium]MBO0891525.1 heavy-metal-associated domain-containing protein [Acidothermales bacterium]
MPTKTYAVDGMTCEHCVNAVRAEVGALDGVREVAVSLVPGGTSSVSVESDAPLTDEQITTALDEAGYALAGGS